MKCAICNRDLVTRVDAIEFSSQTLGVICVPEVRHKICESCGDILISSEESRKVIDHVKSREQRAIGRLPVSEFISLNEAAEILEITKQAFSKNQRIRNGFIYSVKIGDRTYYNRRSVEQFKETGNGRYLIPGRENIRKAISRAPEYFARKWIPAEGVVSDQQAAHKNIFIRSLGVQEKFIPYVVMKKAEKGKRYA